MTESRPTLPDRLREVGWALFGCALGAYLAVQLLAAVWLWLVVLVVLVMATVVAVWTYRRRV
jgi:uncharacterized membrane protein AbrB (regulator of aidB expression)